MSKRENVVCCVCGDKFSSSFQGKPYCNKHYLRLYTHGTTDKLERKKTNTYEVKGGILEVTTAKGMLILADAKDYELICQHSWCISKTGYAVANINNRVVKMHRYILGLKDSKEIIDHINGNPLDNRRCNLRICANSENSKNCGISKNNTSGVTGVQKIKKTGKYRARITVNRREIRLGHYDSFDEAVKARKQAEIKYFGEFAPCKCRNTK